MCIAGYVVKNVANQVGKQIVRQAPKYCAKTLLAIPTEVAVYFTSQALIKRIKEAKGKQKIEVVEA